MPAYKDKNTGKWYCQFYYTDWQGRRKHTSKRGFARKKDAEEWEAKYRYGIRPQKITMSYLLDRYIEHLDAKVKLGTLRATTRERYLSVITQHIRPYFNQMCIEDITTDTINKWLVALKPATPYSQKLAPSYVNTLKTHLSVIFNYAIKEFDLAKNPAANAECIKKNTENKRAKLWTLEEYSSFYSTLKKDTHKVAFNLMFWAGLRIGEVLALRPSNFSKYKITVTESKAKVNRKSVYTSPKTKSSIREVAIPQFLYYQVSDYLARLPYLGPDDRIFHCSKETLAYILKTRSESLGLPYISPHILRHSYASLLLNITKDPTVVARQIGHANPNITLSVYSHMLPGEEKKAAEILDRIATKSETIDINLEKTE